MFSRSPNRPVASFSHKGAPFLPRLPSPWPPRLNQCKCGDELYRCLWVSEKSLKLGQNGFHNVGLWIGRGSSPNLLLPEAGWHLQELCQHGEGLLNTQRGSKPWEERERRALCLERMSDAPFPFQPV